MPDISDPRLFAPQCLSLGRAKTIHENPWFKLQNRGGYFTTEYHQSQLIVLPIVEERHVVMIRVKRPVIVDNPLELPAGGLEEGESPPEAAARELAEETGILVQDLTRFQALPPIAGSPNRNPHLTYIFQIQLALGEYEQRKQHDGEIESVRLFDLEELRRILVQGEIYIALPIAVIARYLLSLQKDKEF